MKSRKKHTRRLKNLLVLFAFTAIMVSVATYAWFIGTRTVSVSPFEIEISTTESLLLSLDGERWGTTISVNENNLDSESYFGHTNTWGGVEGLKPVSTIGEMDGMASRMKIFEKTSMSVVPGGYRLLATRMENSNPTDPEPAGYIAFDLFIKNISGRDYITNVDTLTEEAIYLNNIEDNKTSENGADNDSTVTVASYDHGGQAGYGIENSVRVGFAQIGRVIGTETDPDVITSITCNDDGSGVYKVENGVTGICRKATIWEPNDSDHTANAIKWYDFSCKSRKEKASGGAVVSSEDAYSGTCNTLTDGNTYKTYAINSDIASEDNVNIYDGEDYNNYADYELLTEMEYFTDTIKNQLGVDRVEIFTLAPNSITKVRVYVWIEGQDIDNYDFAQEGKAISVKFGFAKERFNNPATNFGYTGPEIDDMDKTTKPEITFTEGTTCGTRTCISVPTDANAEFNPIDALGASAIDIIDEEENITIDLTRKIIVDGKVDLNTPGKYILTYRVSDWWGNYANNKVVEVTVE